MQHAARYDVIYNARSGACVDQLDASTGTFGGEADFE